MGGGGRSGCEPTAGVWLVNRLIHNWYVAPCQQMIKKKEILYYTALYCISNHVGNGQQRIAVNFLAVPCFFFGGGGSGSCEEGMRFLLYTAAGIAQKTPRLAPRDICVSRALHCPWPF